MSDKPKLAKEIKVSRHGLQIDGEEFPWFTALGSTQISVSREELPGVTVTIVADRVLVDDDMDTQVTGRSAARQQGG